MSYTSKHNLAKWIFVTLATVSLQGFSQPHQYPFQDTSLSDEDRIENLLSMLTLEEKINMFSGSGVERLGVRTPGSTEAIHGIVQGGPGWAGRSNQVTTSFPQGYGLGATWDTNLQQQIGDYMATEARYLYQSPKYKRAGLILWAPNADLGRDVRWGRTEECFGEDPFLVGEMSVALIKGIQGDDPTYWKGASLMKHFLANSNEYGRTVTSSDFDDTLFREYYAYPFAKGIQKGGANAMMTAYNAYNGIPCTIHPILKDIVMNEWGLDGMIITDGGAFQQLKNTHKTFDSLDEAAKACIQAGTTRFLDDYKSALKAAITNGLLTEEDLNPNVKGSLRVMLKLGLMDNSEENPYQLIGVKDTIDPWTKQETKDFTRLVANKSAVLLKNNGLLPLNLQQVKRIAVIGNKADVVLSDWYSGDLPYKVTPLQAIQELAEANHIEVRYAKDDRKSDAHQLAEWADVVIACVGNEPTCSPEWGKSPWAQMVMSSEGREDVDRGSLQLDQEDLVKVAHKANPNTVMVLISSFPYAINWSQQYLPSILHITQSCQELGNAVADVLFGKYNPAGRTTQTWVKGIEDLPQMLDYDIRNGRTYMYFDEAPLYPFGHGLSYTKFDYGKLSSPSVIHQGDDLNVSFKLKNTGEMDGEEVVQLYIQYPNDRAAKRLRGFKRIALDKGEEQEVTIQVPADDLALWNDADKRFEVPAGKMNVMVGSSSDNVKLNKSVLVR